MALVSQSLSPLPGKSLIGLAQIGGATGAIGDPSGRSTERNALSPEVLAHNVESITKQFTSFLERGVTFAQSRTRRRDGEEAARVDGGSVKVVNNLDWTGQMTLIDFLSTVGKMARVSTMLSRERCVRFRLSPCFSR